MVKLEYDYTKDLVEIRGSMSRGLSSYLTSLPPKCRTWSAQLGCWVLVPEALGGFLKFSEAEGVKIDTSTLPQHVRNGILNKGVVDTPSNCYNILGLLPSAVDDVVKAAYRTLVKIYHPDIQKTGNKEAFQRIVKAYKKIKAERDLS